jgi:hypothetical protein
MDNIKKIKVAFIYKGSNKFLTGKHFDNTTYDFFMKALCRNNYLDVSYFSAEKSFDTTKLKNKHDVILLSDNHSWGTPDELQGISNLKIPVISRVGDPHDAEETKKISFHEKYKIDYYFNFMHESYFYKFYPKDFKYKTIIFGLEPKLYQNSKDFKNRIKNRILNSGAIGKSNIKSRVANRILNPNRSSWYFYKLRTICNNLPHIDHTGMIGNKYMNDNYPSLLSRYRAAIAATTFYPTIKYWEIPSAGCLTFMEITDKNKGGYLGYEDNKTAIFINEKNYKQKFENYLSEPDNPKWEKIANAGKKFTIEELNNDKAVESLVDLMNEILNKK